VVYEATGSYHKGIERYLGEHGFPIARLDARRGRRFAEALGEDKEVGFALNGAFKDNDVFQRIVESFGLSSPVLISFGLMKGAVVETGLLERDLPVLINLAYDRSGEP